MVFMNSLNAQVLYKQYVVQENAALYGSGLQAILSKDIHIQSIKVLPNVQTK